MLIAYFSWSGSVRNVAKIIHEKVSGDIFEIVPVKPYSTDYNTCIEEAKKDKEGNIKPELKNHLSDIKSHDVVILGYPNWWYSIPMPVVSFLSEYDFAGKSIAPFCSHGGGGLAKSIDDIKKLLPNTKILEALSLKSGGGKSADQDVTKWLKAIGLQK